MLTVESLRTRVHRLNDLYRGLAKEVQRLETEKDDPLLFLERYAYRMAMHNAVEALEAARVVLATAVQRTEEEAVDRIEKDAAARQSRGWTGNKPDHDIIESVPSRVALDRTTGHGNSGL